jgi:hypothetical protein
MQTLPTSSKVVCPRPTPGVWGSNIRLRCRVNVLVGHTYPLAMWAGRVALVALVKILLVRTASHLAIC